MPMYEFKCGECDHTMEKLMGLNDPQPKKCPECGKRKLKKVPFGSRPAALHMKWSPMHPRHMRGQRPRR